MISGETGRSTHYVYLVRARCASGYYDRWVLATWRLIHTATLGLFIYRRLSLRDKQVSSKGKSYHYVVS
jgi:hypothetical protein